MTRNNKFRALAVSAAAVIAFALGAGSLSAAAASADDVSGDQSETTTSQGTGTDAEGRETPGSDSRTEGNEGGTPETGDETEPGAGDDQQPGGTEDKPGEGDPDGDETADPTVTLEWYPVEDENVSDQPVDVSNGPTNVTEYRVDVIVNDPAFAEKMQAIAEAEESGNDAVAAEAGDTAIALTVDDGDDATKPVTYSAEYSDFVQSKDDAGENISNQYELTVDADEGTDNRLSVEFPEGDTTYTLSLGTYMDEDSQSEGWPQFITGLGDSNQLHVDTVAPGVTATISGDESSWSKQNSIWVSQDEQSMKFTVSEATEFQVLDANNKSVNLDSNEDGTWTWRLTSGNDYYLDQYHVNATDQAGNTFNKPVADLLSGGPTTISIPSDEQVAGELRIISKSAENDYYRNVTGFSYTYKNPDSWRIQIAIGGLGDSQMMTLTHGDESVNMDCKYANGTISCSIADGTVLADGDYTVTINRKLAKNQQKTFNVDNTAPTVDNVKYVADADNDLQNGGEVLAFNSLDSREQAKRSLTFSVTESGVGFDKDDVTISGTYEDLDGNEHDLRGAYEVDVRPNHQVEVTFTKPGSYDFKNITIQVHDALGNDGETKAIGNIATVDGTTLPAPLTISDVADITSDFEVVEDTTGVVKDDNDHWYAGKPTVQVTIKGGKLAEKIAQAMWNDTSTVFSVTRGGKPYGSVGYGDLAVKKAPGTANDKWTVTWTVSQADGDGKYEFAVSDADSTGIRRLFGSFDDDTSIDFNVDNTAPTVDSVTYNADANDIRNGDEVLAFGDPDSGAQTTRSLTFTVTENGVGFDAQDVTISGTYKDLDHLDDDAAAESIAKDDYDVTVDGSTVTVTFKTPGSYDFGNINIAVEDNLENGSGSQTIADITGSEKLPSPLTITDSADESQITSTFKVTATGNAPVADGVGLQWYNAEPTVSVQIGRNNLTLTARILKALKDDGTVVFTSTHNGENQADVTFKNLKVSADGDVSFTLDGDGEYSYSVPDASNTAVRRLFGQFETPEIEFGVDTQQPTIVSVTGGSANTSYDDKPVYAAVGDQTLTVNVRDFFKGSDSSTEYTAGLKSVTVDIPAATDLNGKQLKDATTETLEIDGNGNGTITLPAEGYYDLSKVTIHAADLVDNNESRAVTDVDTTVDMQAVASIAPGAPAVASVTLTDKADDARKQVHQGYYRGHNGVDATYTVTDMWFPLARNAASVNGEDLLSGSSVAQSASDRLAALKVTDDWQKSGEYTWTITKPVLLDGHDNAAEGVYDLDVHYQGLHGTMAAAKVDGGFLMDGTHFVIDWTAPTIGDVSFATMDTNWRGLLFSESQTVTLSGISDNIAGVRADSKQFATVDGNGNVSGPAVSYDAHISGASLGNDSLTYDAVNGTLSFSMDADSFRLNAKGTALAISDEAGNYVSTGDFSGLPVFADNGIETLVIDNVAPTISVVYDNNDVRNGKYYNAHRTGTLTLTDSNLDLIAGRDADRTVLTVTVDGATDRTVTLGSLSAGDDGRTYTASFSAASDGDWVIDAGFADVVPTHARVSFHDEFTVDTVAPVLEMTFDNNNVANGMYYNAPRTATVTQTERNMSESESVVTTTARDDAGAEQAAPGASGWVRAGGERESTQWTNTVPFTGEMHYTISATATDLAGNVAQEVSSPEFVIDLTDPEITIDRVEDQTAYAGTVAPLIDFSDTNIDPDDVSYTITGVHRGELRDRNMPANTVTETDNTRTIDFADFERKTDIDDVYTIKATATDMAGNTFEAEKTFSVNRFGSTYTFDAGTQNLRGVYLKKSQDVRVTEINVSGLDPTLSQIVVAKDDNAVTLHAGDYTTTPGDVQGWTETVYTIPAKNFADDGYYRVQVQSVDKAGNLSQNTMDEKNADRTGNAEVNFAVDSTAPTASLLGVESGAVYYDQQGRDVGIDSKDNMGLMRTELYVDGSKVQEWKGEESLESTPQYVLAAGDGAREIVVRTTDMAGNQATSTYDNVYVASNWWQYAIHTAWIRNTMIFGLILLVAVVVMIAVLAVQHRKRYAYRRNPFGM